MKECKENPILKKKDGTTFQHYSIGRDLCVKLDCEHKLCGTPCTDIKEKSYVGHGTHDGNYPKTVFASSMDFKGDNRNQYAQMYEKPVLNDDLLGTKTDVSKTLELNKNPEMKANIHMNSSTQQTQPPYSGSNDAQNLN